MACALLPQLLPPVVSDLTAWTVAQRAAAARSLHTLLVLSEGGVTSHLPSLLPALCSAIADEDAEVAGWVIKAVHVLGAHVAPSRWLPLMMDHLTQ
jgi:dynein assembly factor 5